jgi:hypothetical protein
MFLLLLAIIVLLFILKNVYRSDTKYLIMRHSEREDATNPAWTSDRPYDTPITTNRKFFEKSIKKYDMSFFKNAKIYCSPFKRCIQTAQMISELFEPKLKICLEPALIEVSSMEFYLFSSPPSFSSSFSLREKEKSEKEKEDYFSNEEIFKRHKGVNFDRNYKPFFSKYDLEMFFKSDKSYESSQKKMKDFLKGKDSCICVAHREFINIVDPKLPDDYCSTALVDKNLKLIV